MLFCVPFTAVLFFSQLNDPTIVQSAPSPGIPNGLLIMYMTCVLKGKDGLVLTNNWICFSTSLPNDGLNWSRPVVLVKDTWLPAALRVDNDIVLFASSTSTGVLMRRNLGPSGIDANAPTVTVTFDTPGAPFNVEVRNIGGTWYMTGQRFITTTSTVIDMLLTSDKGLSFVTVKQNIVAPVGNFVIVGTPAMTEANSCIVWFGTTTETNSLQMQIFASNWCSDACSPTCASSCSNSICQCPVGRYGVDCTTNVRCACVLFVCVLA